MSLIAAGLAAEGQTRVMLLETVERGYSQLVERLVALRAKVEGRVQKRKRDFKIEISTTPSLRVIPLTL
jgi:hypothetical protein